MDVWQEIYLASYKNVLQEDKIETNRSWIFLYI